MSVDIRKYLDDLENRLNENEEEELLKSWYDFADQKLEGQSYFNPSREPKPSGLEWEKVLFNETFDDYDNMIYKQLLRCNEQLTTGGGELLVFRSSYGTGLIPSMFGCEIRTMPDEQDSLPTSLPLTEEEIRKIIDNYKIGIKPDVRSGLGQKTFDAAHHLEKLLEDYPKLQKYLNIYTPDTEGPCSLAESIVGSELHFLFYDEEEYVHDLIEVITDTFIRYVQEWKSEFPSIDESHAIDWGLLHRGGILIREDSATNISPNMYEEFFMEADQKIFDAFGGGILHFCGKGDHLIEIFSELRGLNAINMSQPDWNDMDKIYANTIEKKIEIIGMPRFEIRRCDRENINLKGLVQAGICVAAWMGEPEEDPRDKNSRRS